MVNARSIDQSDSSTHGSPNRRRLSRRWVPIVVVAVVIFSFANVAISLSRPTIPDEIEGLVFYPDLTPTVADGEVSYAMTPPAGGAHAAKSLECGIYFHPVENRKAVAALATGAVWFAYRPDISEETYSQLEDFTEGEFDTFMTPYPGLQEPVVITAWGVQLVPDGGRDTRIASFIRDYKNSDRAPYTDLRCGAEQSVPAPAN